MEESNKAVVFQVGKEEYAISIQHVISIEKMEGITPIPHLPIYVNGIFKVRGELMPVIDFEQVLYNRPTERTEATKIIVLQTDEISIGIVVTDAKEIISIPQENIKQIGLVAYKNTAYITGIANLESRLITIIDPSRLVRGLDGIKQIREYMEEQKNPQ